MSTEISEHAEIRLLIPWYVNGSLSESERLAVSRHAKVCAECRHELRQMQYLHVRWQEAPAGPQVEGDFARLMAAVEQAEQGLETQTPQPAITERQREDPSAARRWRWRDTLRDWFTVPSDFRGRRMALASVVCVLVVLTLANRFPQWLQPNTFRTVATPGSMASLAERDLRIVFAPGVRPEQITDLLGSLHAHVVDGPTEIGAFTVRLDGLGTNMDDIASVAGQLRSNPLVIMAEPALPPTPTSVR